MNIKLKLDLPDNMNVSSLDLDIGLSDSGTAVVEVAQQKAPVLPAVEVEADEIETVEAVEPEPEEPVKSISLASYYLQNMHAQKLKGANEKTCKDHLSSAEMFDEFAAAEFPEPLAHVLETEPELFESFARWLLETRQNSTATVSKRLMHVQMITGAMVKADTIRKVRSNEVPPKHLTNLSRQILGESSAGQRRIPSLDEIKAIAGAVDSSLDYPYKENAERFWSGWIQFCAMYGPRCRDVVSVDPDRAEKRGLLKSDVYFETLCPVADVNAALDRELHSPHGWLHYAIGKDHKSDNKRILLPMSEVVSDWIRHFMGLSPDGDNRVFPGAKLDSFLTQRPLSERWNSLLKAAAVDQSIRLSEGKGEVLAIRKSAANWWKLQTEKTHNDTRLAENVADYLLHHSTTTVSQKHYLSVQASVLPVMIELLPTFPVLGTVH